MKDLEKENAYLRSILAKIFPEKSGDYFICGESSEKDSLGLPNSIAICPSYGTDIAVIYTKEKQ